MSIKDPGKAVTLEHIIEKVGRDISCLGEVMPSKAGFEEALESLVKDGMVSRDAKGFKRRSTLDAFVRGFVASKRGSLNRSYYLVYIAERFYPSVSTSMLQFLTKKPLSAVKVFSGKRDPINEVEPIFVRYSRYKPKPIHLEIRSESDLMDLVHDHCVDFVPYVHGFDGRPDIFLVDLDLGGSLSESVEGFSVAKEAAALVSLILNEKGCHPQIKFSGNRGFQVLCRMSYEGTAMGFPELRAAVRAIREELELRLRDAEVSRRYRGLGMGEPYTTSDVGDKGVRSRKILVDWSSMKPSGDYRAPLSLHYRTGLVSLPLETTELPSFRKEDADPFLIMAKGKDYASLKSLPATTWDALAAVASA